MVGFSYFENVDIALKKLLSSVKCCLDSITKYVVDSLGYISAENVIAVIDYPPFNRSAVDGLAVISSDISSASDTNPIILRIVQKIQASTKLMELKPLNPGEAALIYTGAPLPPNADAVIPLEYVNISNGLAEVRKSLYKYANVSRKGEDFRKGDLLIRKGTRIKPWHISALIQSGIINIKVFRKPRIAIINTGSELVEAHEIHDHETVKIINSTGPLMVSYIKWIGGEPIYIGIVPDDFDKIKDSIMKGLKLSDIVVVSGGSSIGERDIVPDVLESFNNSQRIFHGVAMRPGRTTGSYLIDGKPVIMTSGLPVACLISLEVFLLPLINKLQGTSSDPRPIIKGVLRRRLTNVIGFRSFYRVVVYEENGKYFIEPLRLTGSGIISSLLRGNGLVIIPEDVEGYDEGDVIDVFLLNPIYKSKPVFISW
jgi:molybdopterin molybdotransferase